MSIAESLLPEFDQETANTRKMLERVPEEKFDWRPHPKSGTLGWLAGHLSEMGQWAVLILQGESFDVAPKNGPAYQPPAPSKTRAQLLERFDQTTAAARQAIAQATDQQMRDPWSVLRTGQEVFRMPRIGVLRTMILNHMIHHRGQLSVYLRLNDIPVPGPYGPSADEGGPVGGQAA
jgi:uncharacterized damage-inducible protein DinB